jgi:hypothetical protein
MMSTQFESVKCLNGEIELLQYYGGKKNGKCLEISMKNRDSKMELTVSQALSLAKSLTEFANHSSINKVVDEKPASKPHGNKYYHLWKKADETKVGQNMNCPGCGKSIKKLTYNHKFCNSSCKDHYWNCDESRKERSDSLGYTVPNLEDEEIPIFASFEDEKDYFLGHF